MTVPKTKSFAFVAYTSHNTAVATIIRESVLHANGYQTHTRFEAWEFNDVSGNPVISPILEKIDESEFVVADITYLSLNVIYEVGFTIGRQKRAFLIRHASSEGDKELAKETGIFDTLGYHEYDTSSDLTERLTSYVDPAPLPFGLALDRQAPVYVVEPPTRTPEVVSMISRIKKARYRYRSFNPTEDVRLSANDAVRQVASSSGVLVTLQDEGVDGSRANNVRSQFVAGLAHGMGKPTLILSSLDYHAPIDIRDAVKRYSNTNAIADHIAAFCLEINDYQQQDEVAEIDTGGLLQSLTIGDPTAENEMTTLASYYLRTDEFQRALRGDVNLVVGRKGSGKTALFIQARDKIRADKRNIVVDLKPEGYQLVKIKEDILQYLTEGARQHLITAFWEYLILLEVAYKILEKDKFSYRYNRDVYEAYTALERAYEVESFSVEGDFSERLLTLSLKLSERYLDRRNGMDNQKLTTEQVTELLYTHDIRDLRDQVSAYLKKKEAVWVLFDNLDRGWSTTGVDDIDFIILRCLIDAGRKVERDMRKANHSLRCIVFIRNDVYDHLMRNSADYGKEMRAVLDWTDPDLLREMLRLRLTSSLDDPRDDITFEQIWSKICISHYNGEETSSYIIERSLMRPRNVLKIFNYARGFASNFNRPKIIEDDITKGITAYSQDLLIELNRELTDVFPEADDLLYYFIDAPAVMSEKQLRALMTEAGVNDHAVETITDFLLYYGILGIRSGENDYFIYNVSYDVKPLKIRAARTKNQSQYIINPAFWSALGLTGTS